MGPNATGGLNLQGNSNGLVYLQPLTDPSPYSGMIYWQDPSNTATVQVAGNGSFTIQGTFYAPTALMKITGNGGTYTGSLGQQIAGSAIGSQYVAADLKLDGNGPVIGNLRTETTVRGFFNNTGVFHGHLISRPLASTHSLGFPEAHPLLACRLQE